MQELVVFPSQQMPVEEGSPATHFPVTHSCMRVVFGGSMLLLSCCRLLLCMKRWLCRIMCHHAAGRLAVQSIHSLQAHGVQVKCPNYLTHMACQLAEHGSKPAGEAFDKVARLLGLDLRPNGGAALEKFAGDGNPNRFKFTVPLRQRADCNFSFAGLKTAISLAIQKEGLQVYAYPPSRCF